jgi:hypothetical protein
VAALDGFTIMSRSYESVWVQCDCGAEIAHNDDADLDLGAVVVTASQHVCPAKAGD